MGASIRYTINQTDSSILLDGHRIDFNIDPLGATINQDDWIYMAAAIQAATDFAKTQYGADILSKMMKDPLGGPAFSVKLFSLLTPKKIQCQGNASGLYDPTSKSISMYIQPSQQRINPRSFFHELWHAIDDALADDTVIFGIRHYTMFSNSHNFPQLQEYKYTCNQFSRMDKYRASMRRYMRYSFSDRCETNPRRTSPLKRKLDWAAFALDLQNFPDHINKYSCFQKAEWFANRATAKSDNDPSWKAYLDLLKQTPLNEEAQKTLAEP